MAEVVEDAGGDVGQDVAGFWVVEAGRFTVDGLPIRESWVGDGLWCFQPDDWCAFLAIGCFRWAFKGQAAHFAGSGTAKTAPKVGLVLVGVLYGWFPKVGYGSLGFTILVAVKSYCYDNGISLMKD